MIIHKALHPRDDVDRLYVSKKRRRKKLASTEDSIDASIQLHKKAQMKTGYSHQEESWQHDDQ